MINALCVDVEPWYCNEFLVKYLPSKREQQIGEALKPILHLLDKYKTKATFFVLGIVAEKHSEVVREIDDAGHEIASHAYSHKRLHELGEEKFEEEIKRSVELLESITGEKPIGFRAPSFSINQSTNWALKILEKYGFKYDCSVFPIKTMLYGVPGAPLHPYKPSLNDVTKEDTNGGIIEFPMTVLRVGVNIPIAGGFYLRVLPLWFLKFGIRKVNQTRPAIIYIHPWETYPQTPRLGIPLFPKFVAYYGINTALRKFEGLLRDFEFAPVSKVLHDISLI